MSEISVEISGDSGDGAVRITGGENALVPRAGMRVHDPSGSPRATHDGHTYGPTKVEIGELSNGEYGLAAVNPESGELVDLATLAFGIKADEQGSSIQVVGRSDNNYDYVTDPTYPGPFVRNVRIGTAKRAIVHFSAQIGYWSPGTDARTGKMSFRVIDDVTGEETYPPMDGNALIYDSKGDFGTVDQKGISILVPSWAFPVANRTYTFEARYQVRAFNSGRMYFQNRTMIVQPF